jgi:hypothetical protein
MKSNIVMASALFLCGSLSGGCASMQQDLLEKGGVSIRAESTDDVRYRNVAVSRKATTTTVSGIVSLPGPSDYVNQASHMDVALVDENEAPIFIAYVPYMRATPNWHANQAKFSVSANMAMPDNSVVSLNHHAASVLQHQR